MIIRFSHIQSDSTMINIESTMKIWKLRGNAKLLNSFCFRKYNDSHNILRLFDVLPNFPFTTNEAMHNYYLQTPYIRVASRVAERLNI